MKKGAKFQPFLTLKWKEKSKTKIKSMCKDAKGNNVEKEVPAFQMATPWNYSLTPFQNWMQLHCNTTSMPKVKQILPANN